MDHLPSPQPDVERFKTVLRNGKPDRVPLIELAIAEEVTAALAGRALAPLPADGSDEQWRAWAEDRVSIWHRLGYDHFRTRVDIPLKMDRLQTGDTASDGETQRSWVNEHSGLIQSREDFERFYWPTKDDLGFDEADAVARVLPDGMGLIGFSGGVLEWASELLGLMNFSILLFDDPALVQDVVDLVGQLIYDGFERFCRMDEIFALWLGDDMGFKTSTLISPDDLRKYILPWHRKYAELAHANGLLFMLHSCGNVEAIMPDLIDDVKIDAKHSFEDVIVPVEKFQERWGDRVAVLGGVDVDLLGRGTTDAVRRRTRTILETCAPKGGYAAGSGNSITNYVSPENYLAMLETVHEFNESM